MKNQTKFELSSDDNKSKNILAILWALLNLQKKL